MTLPARLLCCTPVTPLTALVLLLLCLLGSAGLGALLLLALDHRTSLARVERKQDANAQAVVERLSSDRACVLRDITLDRKKSTDDENSS